MSIRSILTILIIAGSFQNIIQISVDTKAPDFFFISIDQSIKNDFQEYILNEYPKSELVFAPIASARINEVKQTPIINILDEAKPPVNKSKPNRVIISLLSLLAGFLFGASISIIRY